MSEITSLMILRRKIDKILYIYDVSDQFLVFNKYMQDEKILDQEILIKLYNEQIKSERFNIALWILDYINENNYHKLCLPDVFVYEARSSIKDKLAIWNKLGITKFDNTDLKWIKDWNTEMAQHQQLECKIQNELDKRSKIEEISTLLIEKQIDFISRIYDFVKNNE